MIKVGNVEMFWYYQGRIKYTKLLFKPVYLKKKFYIQSLYHNYWLPFTVYHYTKIKNILGIYFLLFYNPIVNILKYI